MSVTHSIFEGNLYKNKVISSVHKKGVALSTQKGPLRQATGSKQTDGSKRLNGTATHRVALNKTTSNIMLILHITYQNTGYKLIGIS